MDTTPEETARWELAALLRDHLALVGTEGSEASLERLARAVKQAKKRLQEDASAHGGPRCILRLDEQVGLPSSILKSEEPNKSCHKQVTFMPHRRQGRTPAKRPIKASSGLMVDPMYTQGKSGSQYRASEAQKLIGGALPEFIPRQRHLQRRDRHTMRMSSHDGTEATTPLELQSRRIIGPAASEQMREELVCDSLVSPGAGLKTASKRPSTARARRPQQVANRPKSARGKSF